MGNLFGNVSYENNSFITDTCIAKLGNEMESSIMKKLNKKPPMSKYLLNGKIRHKNDIPKVWYHNAPQYWIHASVEKPKGSNSHNKEIFVCNDDYQFIVTAILNSSLFYWYFIKVSNCRDLTMDVIRSFPIDIVGITNDDADNIKKYSKELLKNFRKHSMTTVSNRKNTGNVKTIAIFPKHGKSIIDKIDDILAKQYKFTRDEVEFIKNFDLEFRMGK